MFSQTEWRNLRTFTQWKNPHEIRSKSFARPKREHSLIAHVKLGAHCAQLPFDWINWPNLFKYIPFIHLSILICGTRCAKLCIDFICGVAFIGSKESKTNYYVRESVWMPTFTFDSRETAEKKNELKHFINNRVCVYGPESINSKFTIFTYAYAFEISRFFPQLCDGTSEILVNGNNEFIFYSRLIWFSFGAMNQIESHLLN